MPIKVLCVHVRCVIERLCGAHLSLARASRVSSREAARVLRYRYGTPGCCMSSDRTRLRARALGRTQHARAARHIMSLSTPYTRVCAGCRDGTASQTSCRRTSHDSGTTTTRVDHFSLFRFPFRSREDRFFGGTRMVMENLDPGFLDTSLRDIIKILYTALGSIAGSRKYSNEKSKSKGKDARDGTSRTSP